MKQGRPRAHSVSNKYHLNVEACKAYLKKVPIELLTEELEFRATTERADFMCAKMRLLRAELGLTQKTLAHAMRVTKNSVCLAERGLRKSAAERYVKFLVMVKEEREIKERDDARKVARKLSANGPVDPGAGRGGVQGQGLAQGNAGP